MPPPPTVRAEKSKLRPDGRNALTAATPCPNPMGPTAIALTRDEVLAGSLVWMLWFEKTNGPGARSVVGATEEGVGRSERQGAPGCRNTSGCVRSISRVAKAESQPACRAPAHLEEPHMVEEGHQARQRRKYVHRNRERPIDDRATRPLVSDAWKHHYLVCSLFYRQFSIIHPYTDPRWKTTSAPYG